jgi:hypothetical protein
MAKGGALIKPDPDQKLICDGYAYDDAGDAEHVKWYQYCKMLSPLADPRLVDEGDWIPYAICRKGAFSSLNAKLGLCRAFWLD